MTDKVSYKYPSWNPFAAAADSNIFKSTSGISKMDEGRLQRIENTKKLREALRVIDYTRLDDLEPDELQDLIDDGLLDLSKKEAYFKQEVPKHIQNNSTTHSKGSTSYRKQDTGPKKAPVKLEPMQEEQRDHDKERIVGSKINLLIDDLKKLKHNVVEMGFLYPPLAEDIIRAADSLHKYWLPLIDDTWTQGEWKNALPQFAEKIRVDHDWPEDPKFIRWRFSVSENGKIENRHPYTHEHMVGTSIIDKLNIVMQIADCMPTDFFKLLWENDERTRHQQILKREQKRSESRTGKKKKKNGYKISPYTDDPDDYDQTLDIHGHPKRHPAIPPQYKNDEEFCCLPEADRLGFMKKGEEGKGDYREFFKALDVFHIIHPFKTEKESIDYENLKKHYLIFDEGDNT